VNQPNGDELVLLQRLETLEEVTEMSDKPREWPNGMKAARDTALDEVLLALRAMIPLVNMVDDPEGLRRLIEINRHLDRIKDLMVEAGAPYRPV
jgi:hypothetical protein